MLRPLSAVHRVLAALVLVGLAGPVLAGQEVPFRGTLEGSFTVIPVNPPAINRELSATGEASLLGDFTYDFPHSVDRSVTPATGEGFATFTASNGDQVFAYVYGEATLVAPGVLHVVELGEIIGGTGRFANASGGYTVDRLVDTVNLTTVGTFDGTLTTPGAGKK